MIDVIQIWMFATPLVLAGCGEALVQKSGIVNIGLEGQMLAAAYVGVAVAVSTGSVAAGIGAGILAGAALACLFGLFTINLSADQVVVGTAVNLLALGLTGALYRSRFGAGGALISVPQFPRTGQLDWVMLVGALAAVAISIFLARTRFGLVVRAAGEYPDAAQSAGYSVWVLRWTAILVGGALAGLAGAYLSLGVAGSFSENMTQGRGFVAIAMVTFGRWRPMWVLGACLLMGLLDSLQFTAQAKGWNIPFQLLLALPYLIALAVLVVVGRGAPAPAALALPFRRVR